MQFLCENVQVSIYIYMNYENSESNISAAVKALVRPLDVCKSEQVER